MFDCTECNEMSWKINESESESECEAKYRHKHVQFDDKILRLQPIPSIKVHIICLFCAAGL